MAVVTYSYYKDTYFGEGITATDFPRYEARAEQIISAICKGQYETLLAELTAKGLTSAADKLTTAYSNAICAQIEYLNANGIVSVSTGKSGDGFTVGKVSVQGSGTTFAMRGATMVSPSAQMFLEQTGLLNRGISVPCEPFAPFPLGVM